ncbi:MAG TPA: OmpA family protein [Brumimicrobium sp.]|nr:OmpA family protein [Brumimicrobium sp.]
MKIILFTIAITFAPLFGLAQPLNVEENFDNNILLWEVENNKTFDSKIAEGLYTIDHFSEENAGRFYFKDFKVNDDKDFIIEMKARMISGPRSNGFGLTWGASGWQNSNRVAISGDGHFKVEHYEEEKFFSDIEWKKDVNIVNLKDEFNTIRVHKKNDTVKIFINDIEIGVLKARPFSGSKIGFYISANMMIQVDYLHIYQYGDANINLVENPTNGYEKENLGKNINGKFSDLLPLISSDGNTLYFVKEGYDEIANEGQEAYYSVKDENGTWTKALNIGAPINNSSSNAVTSVSPDGNTLVVRHTYNEDGTFKSSGLSISNRTKDGWELPKELKIQGHYNDANTSEFCLSSNKNVLIMTVNRKDTYGEKDLYVSFMKDGEFVEPINMGSVLNTTMSEETPFLAADDRTLYFSTEGHSGYGSNDIFVSRRLDDTWTNWSAPKNLGPEINSVEWDAYFTVTASGEYAYMVSRENSLGQTDIFKIKVPEAAKPTPLTLIKGKVLNAKTKEPIFSEIIYQDLNTNKVVGRALSDPNTGDYQIVLPSGVMYGFLAEKESFYPVSNFVDASALSEYSEVQYDLLLSPIEVGENIRLNNLFFATNQSELEDISISELDRLVDFLKANPNIVIEIGGHTDNVGAPAYNQSLSEKRSQSVTNYLISKSIDQSRFTAKGYGLSKPIADNSTEEGRAINRRVEMKILEK